MPNETFGIDYAANDTATPVINNILAAIKALDAAVTTSKANLKGFADAGAASLNKLQVSATAANTALTTIQGSITQSITATNSMVSAVQGLVSQLGSLTTALNQANTATNTANRSMSRAGTTAASSGSSFLESRLKMLAFGAVMAETTGLINAFAEGAEKARLEVLGWAEANVKLRESAREVSAIQGFEGPTDVPVAQIMQIAAKSGMTPEEATKLSTEYENSAATGRSKGNILGKVGENGLTKGKQAAFEEQIKQDVATFALSKGMAPDTAGDLAGSMPTYQKIESREQFAGILGGIAYGLDEARGHISTLAKSELSVASSTVNSGHMKDLVEVASFIGVASIGAKSASGTGTAVRQLDSLLNKQQGEGGFDYLERIGATKVKGDFEKLGLVRQDVLANSGGDIVGYLNRMGFHSQQERNVGASFISNYGILDERRSVSEGISKDGQRVLDANESFKNTDLGKNRLAQSGLAVAQYLVGKKEEPLATANIASMNELITEGEIGKTTGGVERAIDLFNSTIGKVGQAFKLTSGLSQRERKAQKRSFANLRKDLHENNLLESEEEIHRNSELPPKARALAAKYGNGFLDGGYIENSPEIFKELSEMLPKGATVSNVKVEGLLGEVVEIGRKQIQLQEEANRKMNPGGGFNQGGAGPRR